jgi:hypothetical protein
VPLQRGQSIVFRASRDGNIPAMSRLEKGSYARTSSQWLLISFPIIDFTIRGTAVTMMSIRGGSSKSVDGARCAKQPNAAVAA